MELYVLSYFGNYRNPRLLFNCNPSTLDGACSLCVRASKPESLYFLTVQTRICVFTQPISTKNLPLVHFGSLNRFLALQPSVLLLS